LAAKSGSRGKIQERCCHGRMASWQSQRRTVAVDTAASRPLAIASVRNSARLQRPSGTPRVAGSSHAIALTSATTAAANARGRPGRGRSRRPAHPSVQNRLCHLRTVLGVTPTRRAISAVGRPAAAPSTILARTTCRCGTACDCAARVSARRSLARKLIWNRPRPPPRAILASTSCRLGQAGGRPGGTLPGWEMIAAMAAPIPESTQISLQQRLTARARERWPALAVVKVRVRGRFAYVDGAPDRMKAG
jgi:hypothetical protein